MSRPPRPSNVEPHAITVDPLNRLSLAVKELNRLINRAKHLGELAKQPFPQPPDSQPSEQHPIASNVTQKK